MKSATTFECEYIFTLSFKLTLKAEVHLQPTLLTPTRGKPNKTPQKHSNKCAKKTATQTEEEPQNKNVTISTAVSCLYNFVAAIDMSHTFEFQFCSTAFQGKQCSRAIALTISVLTQPAEMK